MSEPIDHWGGQNFIAEYLSIDFLTAVSPPSRKEDGMTEASHPTV